MANASYVKLAFSVPLASGNFRALLPSLQGFSLHGRVVKCNWLSKPAELIRLLPTGYYHTLTTDSVSSSHCLHHENESPYADKDITYAKDIAKWQPGWEKKDIRQKG